MYDTKMKKSKSVDTFAEEAFAYATKANDHEDQLAGLLTRSEKIKIGRRLLIAQAILAGKTRMEINIKLSVSPNTFAQINRWLEDEFSTYTSAYTPQKMNRKYVSKYIKPFSYEHLKRNYPAHFLLFSLSKELWKKK